MLDKILKVSLSARVSVLIFAALVLIAGLVAVSRTEVDIFPDLNAPTVTVLTEAPGFSPEEVERGITFPVETAVNGATGVRRVSSASQTGFSIVKVEFDWGTDVYRARQTVSEKIAAVAREMPSGAGSPTLGPQSSILGEVMIIGLTSDSVSQSRLRTYTDRVVKPRLLALGGVSQVSVIGGDVAEYQIRLDPARMRRHGVTLEQVRQAVTGLNSNHSAGVVYDYGNEYLVKADIATADAEKLGMAVVGSNAATGASVTIHDIAEVGYGTKSPKLGVASINARPGVLLTLTKQPGIGTINLTRRIDDELADISRSLPEGVEISTDIFRQADFISTSVSNLQISLIEGAFFVVVVLFFFLMNLRTTLISLVALPLSILVSVIALALFGFTINTMSLGGIAIAIGSIVDDAIVDVENVYKRLRQNRLLPEAERRPVLAVVYEASREVRLPIFNSTLIIVAGFLPLFFLSGIEGRLMMPLGIAFVVALFASTAVALTVTPVLCYYLLSQGKADKDLKSEPRPMAWLKTRYLTALPRVMHHRRRWIWGTASLLVFSIAIFFTLGRSFLPPFNEGSFTISLSALPGISLEESDRLGHEAEKIILELPEIQTVARKTGRAELDEHSFGVNVSEIEAPYSLGKRSKREVMAELRERLSVLPGINVEIGQPVSHRIDAMLSGSKSQIAVKLFGNSLERLNALGGDIKRSLEAIPGLVDVNIEQLSERPQLSITPRRELLAKYGVSMPEFGAAVATALGGERVSQVYVDGYPQDITLKVGDLSEAGIEDVRDLPMAVAGGGFVPLDYLADVRVTQTPSGISRENATRRIMISANVDGRDLAGAVADIRSAIEQKIVLPEGYHIEYGGQFENESKTSRTIALASLLALLIIFMLLYKQFGSVGQSLIILLNMPLAAIGGILMLRLTSGELNIPAIIGLVSLLGITTRNGMLLMSRYDALRRTGVPLWQRITEGSADRLGPIVMTSLTSALALLPLAFRGDLPGNELQSPLAIVIIGGLLTSTILNLFIVPLAYYLYSKKRNED